LLRSLRELALGEGLAALLQTAGLAADLTTQGNVTAGMQSPFARQDSQAAAVAAGALSTQLAAETAEVNPDAGSAEDAAASAHDDADGTFQTPPGTCCPALLFNEAVDAPLAVATNASCMPDANAVEGDAIRTASAGDLPVQAVLDELEELLAHCPPRHLHTRTSSPSPSPTPSPPSGFSNSPADARVSLCNSTSAAGGLWTHSGQVSMICCQGGQVVPLADPACDSLLLCDMLQDHLQPQRPDCHASSNNATSDRQVEGPLASSEGCDDIRQEPLAAQSSQQPTAASPSSAGCYGNGSGATSPAIIEPNSKRPIVGW
jgi:hypothetical protein